MVTSVYFSFWFLIFGSVVGENNPPKKTDRIYKILAASGVCPQNRQTQRAPNSYIKKINPFLNSPDAIAVGEKLYHKEAKPIACRLCHGIQGNGDGKLAINMEPPPRNFTCDPIMKNLPDGQLFWVIKNGSMGTKMPIHKETLTDRQIWQVIRYIRQFETN